MSNGWNYRYGKKEINEEFLVVFDYFRANNGSFIKKEESLCFNSSFDDAPKIDILVGGLYIPVDSIVVSNNLCFGVSFCHENFIILCKVRENEMIVLFNESRYESLFNRLGFKNLADGFLE